MTATTGHMPVTQTAPDEMKDGGVLLPTLTLWRREMVRFVRQRNRVVSALLTPLVFWLLLGLGLNDSFNAAMALGPNAAGARPIGYLEYFFPGTLAMVLLFTAIFSTISVIEDRRAGFMQGVLAAPAPRLAIVLGKVLGGASLATIQAGLLLALWPIVGHFHNPASFGLAVAVMFVLAMGMTGLGLCLAWPMDSTAGFHAVMNLVLLPMWFLSGAVFPVAGPIGLRALMYLNPMTSGVAALRWALTGDNSHGVPGVPIAATLGLLVLFTIAVIVFAVLIVRRPRKDGT